MNHVACKNQRDVQTAVFHSLFLQFVDYHWVHLIENRADAAGFHNLHHLRAVALSCLLIDLTDFLFQSHLRQQLVDFFLDIIVSG